MTNTDAGERPDEPTDLASQEPAALPDAEGDTGSDNASDTDEGPRPRRRGSRGGRSRNRPSADGSTETDDEDDEDDGSEAVYEPAEPSGEVPEGNPAPKPRIGDTRPAPAEEPANSATSESDDGAVPVVAVGDGQGDGTSSSSKRRRRRGGRGRGGSGGGGERAGGGGEPGQSDEPAPGGASREGRNSGNGGQGGGNQGGGGNRSGGQRKGQTQGGRGPKQAVTPVTATTDDAPVDLDEKTLSKRRGKERKGRPVGRYLMAVHVQPAATQIAVLEGRSLIEHYVSRPADEVTQIHGNIYLGKVQNVLPGMEAAFVDIGTPKNAVLYRGDTRNDPEDLDQKGGDLRIEQMLKARQTILCQVTKNPIGAKGARLTQEISLPGRFVVLVPNSTTYGISKRLPDNERKRLRQVLDRVKPEGHGLIVRTAAEGISAEELQHDVARLAGQWAQIEALAAKSQAPTLLYRDPDLSIRVIREEFNTDYRQVVIDDAAVYEQVRDYVRSISPALVERVELYDPADHGGLPIYEHHHVHEQLHKALDRKVWLPSGGSLIIERTEALTVIDVNTGKNVGKSSLEETVFKNNLEAAEETARQLRLRDIGGIIVIDFIDMEIRANRESVISTFRQALARDKTRTQVFDISELGLVEMTRKRIGEGLIESLSEGCPTCDGRGMVFDRALIGS